MNLAATKEEDNSQAICTWDRKRTQKIFPSNCNIFFTEKKINDIFLSIYSVQVTCGQLVF